MKVASGSCLPRDSWINLGQRIKGVSWLNGEKIWLPQGISNRRFSLISMKLNCQGGLISYLKNKFIRTIHFKKKKNIRRKILREKMRRNLAKNNLKKSQLSQSYCIVIFDVYTVDSFHCMICHKHSSILKARWNIFNDKSVLYIFYLYLYI